jgi:hypothetical protein
MFASKLRGAGNQITGIPRDGKSPTTPSINLVFHASSHCFAAAFQNLADAGNPITGTRPASNESHNSFKIFTDNAIENIRSAPPD